MVDCESLSPSGLQDLVDLVALYERNTFLTIQPPPQLELCKASSEPGAFFREAVDLQSDREEQASVDPFAAPLLPPPPPLDLEAFETYDSFNEPSEVSSSACATAPAASTICADRQWSPRQQHQFQTPFLTLPENTSSKSMFHPALEGNTLYEWRDDVRQIPFSSAGLHITQGAILQPAIQMRTDIALPLLPAARVPPPPCLPAPCVGAPSEPPNVASPPGESFYIELEAPATDVSDLEFARQPSGITCTVVGSIHHIAWQVDAKKLESQDKQAVSPQFIIDLPDLGPQPFKIALYPKIMTDGKRGASFKKAKGKGKVLLKCEAQLPPGIPDISFRIGIGRGDKSYQPRGPVTHNFSEQSMRGLARNEEEWDFHAAVDESGTFVVSLALAPSVALLAPPHWAWDAARSNKA